MISADSAPLNGAPGRPEAGRLGSDRIEAGWVGPGRIEAGRIEVRELSKTFRGGIRAVDRLSFSAEPGSVTALVGPEGAGKTTTLRLILGLLRPTSGTATIGGLAYRDLPDPVRIVGAALDGSGLHPARTARDHLRILCAAAGLPHQRAEDVLSLVGLDADATRKIRVFAPGMRQRLALASTLLADPRILVLDEPGRDLGADGIRWLSGVFRHLTGEGRTVLMASREFDDVEQLADRAVLLDGGRLVPERVGRHGRPE